MKKVLFTAFAVMVLFAMTACNNKAAEATEDTTCATAEQCEKKCCKAEGDSTMCCKTEGMAMDSTKACCKAEGKKCCKDEGKGCPKEAAK